MVMVLFTASFASATEGRAWISSITTKEEELVYGSFFGANLKQCLDEFKANVSSLTINYPSTNLLKEVAVEDFTLLGVSPEVALARILAGTGYWFQKIEEDSYIIASKEDIKEILKAEEIKAIKAKIAKLKKVKAEEIAKSETEMKEIRTRSALKVEPGKLSKEEKLLPQRRFTLYAVGLDPEYAHVNSGGRFELSLLPSDLRILAEGVELEKEKPAVVFISLMLIPWHRAISPYIGVGGEISEGTETAPGKKSKRYQVFAGTELGENFFLEVKYIDEGRINLKTADVYSAIGFKISF